MISEIIVFDGIDDGVRRFEPTARVKDVHRRKRSRVYDKRCGTGELYPREVAPPNAEFHSHRFPIRGGITRDEAVRLIVAAYYGLTLP